jgi:hypothetical protein
MRPKSLTALVAGLIIATSEQGEATAAPLLPQLREATDAAFFAGARAFAQQRQPTAPALEALHRRSDGGCDSFM